MSTLKATLEKIHTDFEKTVPDPILEIMHRATNGLIVSGLAGQAVHEGSMMPDFELKDSAGNTFSSEQLLEKGPLIVSFFRGFW